MNVYYKSKKLEIILNDERLIRMNFNKKEANNIISRMTEFFSADNLSYISHLPPPRRHKLVCDYKDKWAVSYSENDRIIFEPVGSYDETDLSSIKEIRIIDMGDYH